MVSFAVYSTMNKPKSARLAEIDANIQACMREMQGLGMVSGNTLVTLPPPAVDIIEPMVAVGGGQKLRVLPDGRRAVAAVAVPVAGVKPMEQTEVDKKIEARRAAKKAILDKDIADGKKNGMQQQNTWLQMVSIQALEKVWKLMGIMYL